MNLARAKKIMSLLLFFINSCLQKDTTEFSKNFEVYADPNN